MHHMHTKDHKGKLKINMLSSKKHKKVFCARGLYSSGGLMFFTVVAFPVRTPEQLRVQQLALQPQLWKSGARDDFASLIAAVRVPISLDVAAKLIVSSVAGLLQHAARVHS